MSFTAKSVILDIADNWGDADYLGLRSVDFWYDGAKISLAATDFTAYATSEFSSSYHAENVFDTSLSKTGTTLDTQWYSANGSNTNQRLIVVFDSEKTFDEIRINNAHHEGASTTRGAKNVVIHYSTDSITSTTYNASISNSTKIFDGQFDEHVALDQEDEQTLTLDSGVSAAITGTVTTADEADIVAGGKTIILTLTDDTWVATVGADNAITTALIAGIDSAQSETTGWDAVVKANMDYNDVVRTSDTVVTITLSAESTYDITADETITVTIPATALTGGEAINAGTFNVTAIKYSVTYDGNTNTSGAVPTDSNGYEDGATVTVLGNTGSLIKTGYTFIGWNTLANGTGTSYVADDTFTIGAANVTLYAVWEAAATTYTVTYNGNGNDGGSVPVDSTNYEELDTVTVLGNTGSLTKTNNRFNGWNTAANGTGTSYAAAATFTMGTADVILYAVWEPYVYLTDSTYIASSGTTVTTAQLTAPTGKTTTDFQAGRLSDDTNPLPAIDLAADKYTEIEFNAEIDAAISSGDEIEFRITDNGVVLDTYSVTPMVTATVGVISAACSDGFTFADTATKTAILQAAAAESINLSDSDENVAQFIAALVDSFTIADTPARTATYPVSVSDAFSVADATTALQKVVALVSDSVTFSDVSVVRADLAGVASDNVQFSETLVATLQAQAIAAEIINLSDTATARADLTAQTTDIFNLSGATISRVDLLAAVTDMFNLSDSALSRADLIATLTDIIGISDSSEALANLLAQTTDGFTVSAATTADVLGVLSGLCSDTFNVSDTATSRADLLAAVADALGLSDVASALLIAQAQVADSFTLDDESTWASIAAALVADGFTITGEVTCRADLVAALVDSMTLSDTAAAILTAYATAADGFTVSDTAFWAGVVQAIASDSFTVSGSATGLIKLLAQAAETINFSDSGSVTATYNVQVNDAVEFATAISTIAQLRAAVADGFNVTATPMEVSQLPNGKVSVSFSMKVPGADFSMKTATVVFNIK